MELNIFMRELESALVRRGIPNETAVKHVSNLRRTFTSDDLSEIEAIQSNEEIEELADSISVILNKNNRKPAPAPRPTPQPEPHENRAAPPVKPQPRAAKPEKIMIEPKQKPASAPVQFDEDDFYEYSAEPMPSTKGMLVFWIGLFLTLPITLSLLAVIFGAFAGVFVGLAGLIVAGVAVLIVLVAAGAAVSLIGIIFGITQLFSFLSAGIYEIGLGIMVAGAALFASILIYNFAIRLVPWLITQVGNFLVFVCRKLKSLFYLIRRECYKL